MQLEKSTAWKEGFVERLEEKQSWHSWELYKMSYSLTKNHLIQNFSGLQSLKYLPHVKPLPHQIEVAERVIEEMNGKAILADEVGLGKTIEAGIILKEYLIRGLVKKALILVPASLAHQWIEELHTKFHIPALLYKKNYELDHVDVVVMSLDTAKRSPHKEKVYAQNYDLIIVDEAHKLKNHKTISYEFVESLKKKFCLLLTATPIQNDIFELFYLVTLLKQGHLGNYEKFSAVFSKNKRDAEREEYLKELVSQVMVRNRRQTTGIEWTQRKVQGIPVEFTSNEKEIYRLLTEVKQISSVLSDPFTILTLQREMCSSPDAVFVTLSKLLEECTSEQEKAYVGKVMRQLLQQHTHSKAEKAVELITKANDKVILFTEYRATQLYISDLLHSKNISNVIFNGKLSKNSREWIKHLFQQKAQVLIATESGAEGINLQFCHHIINYDLPWNPMKLEQRIGRVHRLGQIHDVHIYNLAVSETIDDHILSVLEGKIETFEKVVGELDDILTTRLSD
ncbi:ATP-dependent helicase [Sporosarcina sp. PTS2304]|uniref:DEAD/DEAH box helicase n=1 Tax=Sporosarcina sp. PTS2304 TaxID=2283194 RepID=UPI000E0DA8DA|nr:SNF2-related protein [Sporosarcina sp. PTS2304]AXI00157.1 ATP-dependent helicase [Sporosarcina sp. PTS2304]